MSREGKNSCGLEAAGRKRERLFSWKDSPKNVEPQRADKKKEGWPRLLAQNAEPGRRGRTRGQGKKKLRYSAEKVFSQAPGRQENSRITGKKGSTCSEKEGLTSRSPRSKKGREEKEKGIRVLRATGKSTGGSSFPATGAKRSIKRPPGPAKEGGPFHPAERGA